MNGYWSISEESIFFHERDYKVYGEFTHSIVHYHRQIEIYYLLEGSAACSVNTDTFHVEKGGVLVIPPCMPHSTRYSNIENSRMVINCSMDLFPSETVSSIEKPFYVEPQPDLTNEINYLFHNIKKEYLNNEKYAKNVLANYISILLILLLRVKTDRISVTIEENLIEKAISYIQRNYTNRIRITEVARYCGVRPEHLSRTFKRKTNLNFNEYVLAYRLSQAELHLTAPDISKNISEIAYCCGFTDSNYFSSCFKKRYGVTPSQFRRRNREREKEQ